MAKIKDWNVSFNRAEFFTSEDGRRHLIRDERGDVAEISDNPSNIVIRTSDITIVIDDGKKEITVSRK
ncbi:hypothetical protein [Cohnella algarum]|uniref:hypothetical protein n=1 Tax=Cohnella algarum TaxID=2044859 RepID=UPI001966D46F|nr:hypothetical protein [Cohnella algarum]MBN2980107.1 hypothetical protein [Cohnella algarum]